ENAIRYGHRRVRVSLDGGSKRVTFLIEDDGPGVAGSEHERIFEAGVRGAAARNGAGDGAGLGLPLARRLARAAAGDVESLPSAMPQKRPLPRTSPINSCRSWRPRRPSPSASPIVAEFSTIPSSRKASIEAIADAQASTWPE